MIGLFSILSGVTNTDPTQLGLPSLTAVQSADTATSRSYVVAVAGPDEWPGGVTVQIQTRRSPAAFATVSTTPTGTTLTFTKETTQYTVEVRGIAINGGTLTDSDPSAVLTLTIPAALGAVTTGGTPLRWRIRVLPVDASAGSLPDETLPTLLPFRAFGPNRVVIDGIEDPERPERITASAVTWRALSVTGLELGTGSLTNSGAEWRATLNPSESFRLLDIRVTAPDASVTTVRYPVSLVPA